jgi:hypothetical protein
MITSWHIEYIFQDCEDTFISIRVSLMCHPPVAPGLPTDIQILNKSRFTSTTISFPEPAILGKEREALG